MTTDMFDAHFPEDSYTEAQRVVAWEAWNISASLQRNSPQDEYFSIGKRRIAVTDKMIIDFTNFVLTSAQCSVSICHAEMIQKFRSMLDTGRK